MITILVDVESEQLSLELLNFYSGAIGSIQKFLLAHTLISETRSSYLQTVFSRMRFFSVDRIRLSYRYRESIVRTLPPSIILDSYIDDSMGKFYILKKYEQSESRHIDAMVNYIVSDPRARLAVAHHIRLLFRSYQDEGITSLGKIRENLSPPTASEWTIPGITKEKPDESSDDGEDAENSGSIEIPVEMLEALKNRPGWRLLKSPNQALIDPNQPKSIICFPEKAGVDITVEPTRRDPPLQSQSSPSNLASTTESASQKDPIVTDKIPSVSTMSGAREPTDGPVTSRVSDRSIEGKKSVRELQCTTAVAD